MMQEVGEGLLFAPTQSRKNCLLDLKLFQRICMNTQISHSSHISPSSNVRPAEKNAQKRFARRCLLTCRSKPVDRVFHRYLETKSSTAEVMAPKVKQNLTFHLGELESIYTLNSRCSTS